MSTLCSNAKLTTGIVTDQYAHFSACIKNSGTYIACVKRSVKYTKKKPVKTFLWSDGANLHMLWSFLEKLKV